LKDAASKVIMTDRLLALSKGKTTPAGAKNAATSPPGKRAPAPPTPEVEPSEADMMSGDGPRPMGESQIELRDLQGENEDVQAEARSLRAEVDALKQELYAKSRVADQLLNDMHNDDLKAEPRSGSRSPVGFATRSPAIGDGWRSTTRSTKDLARSPELRNFASPRSSSTYQLRPGSFTAFPQPPGITQSQSLYQLAPPTTMAAQSSARAERRSATPPPRQSVTYEQNAPLGGTTKQMSAVVPSFNQMISDARTNPSEMITASVRRMSPGRIRAASPAPAPGTIVAPVDKDHIIHGAPLPPATRMISTPPLVAVVENGWVDATGEVHPWAHRIREKSREPSMERNAHENAIVDPPVVQEPVQQPHAQLMPVRAAAPYGNGPVMQPNEVNTGLMGSVQQMIPMPPMAAQVRQLSAPGLRR